jgi:uncharacterized protein (DUF1330 family)
MSGGPKEINAELIGQLPDTGPVVMVNLVRYPSRSAFLDMTASPEYAEANAHRERGLEKHVIIAAGETYSKLKG